MQGELREPGGVLAELGVRKRHSKVRVLEITLFSVMARLIEEERQNENAQKEAEMRSLGYPLYDM